MSLHKEIYMASPDSSLAPYWRLLKGLYGLKQAGHQWYLLLHDTYQSLGYMQCQSDWSVYIRCSTSALSISTTSVDDLLLASNFKTESDLATSQICQHFTITDGGNTQWLLGCRICHWRDWCVLTLDQKQYISCILSNFNMEHCNTVKTPCPSFYLTSDMCPSTDNKWCVVVSLPYRILVRKCMYLSNCTRPDISFAVCELAHFMSNYGPKHYEAGKHLLQYLQGTRSRGLTYGTTPNPYPIFTSFTDSDWAITGSLSLDTLSSVEMDH